VIAFNYGGRQEMLDATAAILADGLKPEDVTEEVFRSYLYCGDLPYPDVLVRTGGEKRLSNFLLWQTANCVFYATEVPWPEFGKAELLEAIQLYTEIKRVEATV
jgi:undecaprenyl diphosphate synthase